MRRRRKVCMVSVEIMCLSCYLLTLDDIVEDKKKSKKKVVP